MRYLRLFTLIIIVFFAQAKEITYENSYTLIAADSLSPAMEYSFSAPKIRGLKQEELKIFSKPRQYAQNRYDYFVKVYSEMEEFYEEFGNTPILNFVYDEEGSLLYKDKEYLSLRYTMYMYEGGAHGNWHSTHWIIDRKSKEIISFEDIFELKHLSAIKKLNDIALQQTFPEEDINTLLFDMNYEVSKDIYITDNGIIFQYDPYEIAAYVFGSIEVFISWDKLKPYLKITD